MGMHDHQTIIGGCVTDADSQDTCVVPVAHPYGVNVANLEHTLVLFVSSREMGK